MFSAWSFSQSVDFNKQVGLSFKASINGVGADLYYQPTKKFIIKTCAEYLSFYLSSDRIESYIGKDPKVVISNPYGSDIVFNTESSFKTGALLVAVGCQPLKLFYVTIGIEKTLFA